MNRKDYWLHPGIVVKVISKKLGDKYYKQKGYIKVWNRLTKWTSLLMTLLQVEKVKIGNDQEMVQLERNSHSINRGVGKIKMTLKYLYHENMSYAE